MDRRRAASLLALAACIACSAAAPTANNQTALDLYDKDANEGCYYNFQHYGEGDRIMTNEPCLNCTCHNRMLMCYLRVCPFTKPIGQDCTVEKRADQCCPIVTCPDVPVDLLTSTSTSSPAEYGSSGVGRLDRYGCVINGRFLAEGSKVPPMPNKPCEHCYCIRNMTTCVMQECTLHVDGCTPIYHKDVCCPVRYSCDHPEDEIPLLDDMTTTVRPTPGFLLTTTTVPSVTQIPQDCVHDDEIFPDGSLIKTEKACEHCYCMKGDIVCVVQECGTPMENEGKNCTSLSPREGQCCPDTYICEGDNELPLDDMTTYIPPRRPDLEGSGYRIEPDASTVAPSELEGSGEEMTEMYATTISDMSTPQSMVKDEYPSYSTPGESETEVTSEPDKGENTVPIDSSEEKSTKLPFETGDQPIETTPVPKSEDDLIVPVTDITKLDEETVTPKLSTESETTSKSEITQPEQEYTSTVLTKETTQADYKPAQPTEQSETPKQDQTEVPETTSRAPKPTEGEETLTGTEQYVTESVLSTTKSEEIALETTSHEVETEKSDDFSPTTESALMTEQVTEEKLMTESIALVTTPSSKEKVTSSEGTTMSAPKASEPSEENTFKPTEEQFITDDISETATTIQDSETPKYSDKAPITEPTIKITEPTDNSQTTKLSGELDVTETDFDTTKLSPEKETSEPSDRQTDITTEKLHTIAETELPITTMEPIIVVTSQAATQPEDESLPQTTLSDSKLSVPTDVQDSEIKLQTPITDEKVTESSQPMTTSEEHQFSEASSDFTESSKETQTPENYITKADVLETTKPDAESQTQPTTEEQYITTAKITQQTEENKTFAPADVQQVTETVYETLETSSPAHDQVTEKTLEMETPTIKSETYEPKDEQITSTQPQLLDESPTTVAPLATESATDSTFVSETQKPESDSSLPSTVEVITSKPMIQEIDSEEKETEKPSDMELVTESITESSVPVETSEGLATTEPSLQSEDTKKTSQPSTEYSIAEAGTVSTQTTDASVATSLSQESMTEVPDAVSTTDSSERDSSKPSYETTIAEDKETVTTESAKDHTTPEVMFDTTKAFTEITSPVLNEQTGITEDISPTDIKLKDGDLSPDSQFTTQKTQEEITTPKLTTITELTTETKPDDTKQTEKPQYDSEISTDVPTTMQQPVPTDCGTEGCEGEVSQTPISSICTSEDCTSQDCGPDGCDIQKSPDLNEEPESATSIPECNGNECQQPDQNVECNSGNCAPEESCAGDDCKDRKTMTTTAKEEQVSVTTEPSPRKEDVGTTFMENITEDTSDIKTTTISSEPVATVTTEKQEITSVHPTIPTDINDESSTSTPLLPDITTQQADLFDKESTIQPEFESSTNVLRPGIIPGEGNCLVDGKTFFNDSEIPSADKCQTNCRCVSSIVKCDPIMCSLPPDDMVNCQAVYDTTDSCCPTYVCDPTKETIPPQPHSQMSGTESPIKDKGETCTGLDCQQPEPGQSPPSVDCQGQECIENVATPVDTLPLPQKPQECTGENCESEIPSSVCNGADCVPVPIQPACENGQNCDTTPEEIPIQICEGAECQGTQLDQHDKPCSDESCISDTKPTTAPNEETEIIKTENVLDTTEGSITQSIDVNEETTKTPSSQEITHPTTESVLPTTSAELPETQDVQEPNKTPSDAFEQQTTESIIDTTEARVTNMPEESKSTAYPSTDLDKPSTESEIVVQPDTQNTTDLKDCGDKTDCSPQVEVECSGESCVKIETEKPVECSGESCVKVDVGPPVECSGESCVKVDVGPPVECSGESCVKVDVGPPVECSGESCVKVDVGPPVECSGESCVKVDVGPPVECSGESCVKVDVGPPVECSGESCVKVDVGPPVECSGESCIKVDVGPPVECSGESCVKVDVGPPVECSGESCIKVDVGPPVECSGESCVKVETEKPVECTGESCVTVDAEELGSKFGSPCDGEECVIDTTPSTEEIYKQTTLGVSDTSDSGVTNIPEDSETSLLPGKGTDKQTTESDTRGTEIPDKPQPTTASSTQTEESATETTIDTTNAKVTQTPELQETHPAEIITEGKDIVVQTTTEQQETSPPEKYETTLEPFTTFVSEHSSTDVEISEDKIASTALPMLPTDVDTRETTIKPLQDTSAFPHVTEKTTNEFTETDKKTTQDMITQTEEILTTSISPLTEKLPEIEEVTDSIVTTKQPFTATTSLPKVSTLITTPSEISKEDQTDLPEDITEKQYYSYVTSELPDDSVTTTKPEATGSEYLETSTEHKEISTFIPEVPVTVQESSSVVPETQPSTLIDTKPELETTVQAQATTYQPDTKDTTESEMTKTPESFHTMETDIMTEDGAAETTKVPLSTTEKSLMSTEIIETVTEKTISSTTQSTESGDSEPTDITVPTSDETTSYSEHSTPPSTEKIPEPSLTPDDTVSTSSEIIPTQPNSESIIPELAITTTGETYTTTGSPLQTTISESKMPDTVPEQEMQPEAATTNVPELGDSDTKQTEPIPQENITEPTEAVTTPLSDISSQPETTPYLVELEEHTHKDEIMTTEHPQAMSFSTEYVPDEQETVKPTDMPSSYPTSEDKETTEPSSGTESTAGMTTLQTSTPTVTLSDELFNKFGETSEPSLTSQPQLIDSDDSLRLSTILPETQRPQTSTSQPVTEQAAETTETKRTPDDEETVAPTTVKVTPEEATTPAAQFDKYTKPEPLPTTEKATETERPLLGGTSTGEETSPGEESFPPSEPETGYGQEPDYVDEDQAFGPGTCRYGGKVYVSAQQIPRDDPCDFCFCFRSDIICLQQSCPPPIHGCHEEPIQGFCCPRYECPVSMATTMNVTTTTTTTTTTLPPHFLPHAYKGAAQRKGCQIKGHAYKVGEVVRASSGPCLHCTCGGDGQMKCDPKVCTPEPMLRQMIAAAVSSKRRR